jgi:hypothetical protein
MPSTRAVSVLAVIALTVAAACGRKKDAPAPGAKGPAAAPPSAAAAVVPSAPASAAWKGFRPEDGPIVTGKAVSFASLSPSEQKYGIAPARGEGVVYQDQVVLIEHGDKAIKATAGDGLGWTLDGTDPRIAALKAGDIVFATSNCVGRILKLTRTGDDVQVILGPAQITDIIKKGNFAYDAPLDLNSLTAVEEPNFPGAFGSPYIDQMKHSSGGSGSSGSAKPTGSSPHLVVDRVQYFVVSPGGVWRPMRTTSPRPTNVLAFAESPAAGPSVVRTSYSPQSPINNFNDVLSAAPCWRDCGGLGVSLTAHTPGLNIDIRVVLRLLAPRFMFDFNVGGSGPQAQMMLSGGVGFLMTVDGRTDPSFTSNLNEIGAIPVDLTLPLHFGPVPMVLHFHQDLSLSSAFSAKTSILKARDDLRIEGNLGFTYEDGHFDPWHMHATPNVDPSHEINGISMGINSIVVGINQRLLVGLGADGFAAGPYVTLTSTATALKQATEASHLMLAQPATGDCTQATIQMQVNGGIGYAFPKFVIDVVNFFLKLLNAAPISPNGSIAKFREPLPVINERYQLPDGCAGGAGK